MVDAAIVGVLGTIAGGLVTGGLQLRSTSASARHEDRRALLTDRKQVFVDFMNEWRRQRDHYWDSSLERPIRENPPDELRQPLYDLVDPIRLLGDEEVAVAAEEAVKRLTSWVGADDKVVVDRARAMGAALDTFVREARTSLTGLRTRRPTPLALLRLPGQRRSRPRR